MRDAFLTFAISSPVLLFCIFHHAHIMEKHACHSMLSKTALVFGVVAALGAFAAGNCNVSGEWVSVKISERKSQGGKLTEFYNIRLPIKCSGVNLLLRCDGKQRWVNILFYPIWFRAQAKTAKPPLLSSYSAAFDTTKLTIGPVILCDHLNNSNFNNLLIRWPWNALHVLHSQVICHCFTTWEPPSASRASAFTLLCSLSWPGSVCWRDMRSFSTHYASSPLYSRSLSPSAVSFFFKLLYYKAKNGWWGRVSDCTADGTLLILFLVWIWRAALFTKWDWPCNRSR